MSVELLAPKVFISYSHDSQRHKDFVLELANRLRSGGVDANIDQYEESPAEGWQRWMLKQIEASTFVLVVCTEQYYRRFCGHEEIGTGRGVTWEGGIILQEIYDAQARNSKFIPVVISPQDSDFIPNPLRSSTIYCLTLSDRYDALYRRLTNQQEIQRPELGPIELLPPRKRQQFFLNQDEHNRLKEALFNASQGLLEWRRVLGNGQCILRPELRNLQNRIETVDSSTTIILGDSGSGKSTLMADLGHWSVFKQYALLAIKSDYLSNTINAIEDLQRDLQVDRCLEEAIKAIANTEKIILLVDQLDAISDLLDRKSQRLNLLLSLIQRLSGHKNIHIIATCREFEFRYGSQFSRLDSIDQLGLALPTWDAIAPILETAGHLPANMGDSLRELLQTPLHLKIFLDVAHPGEVFTSSQNLLNRLWEEQVLKQSEPSQCIAFLENLANEMTENEVLWLPSAFSDTNPEISRILESAGLLISNPGNSTIGFRHQTYYDYTLARAFARGTQSLTDRVLGNQDGLFIRPVLLRGLSYLRGTAPHQYRQQIVNLVQTCQSQIRSHIRSLLIGFIGSQREPNAAESELMIPLLISEQEGIKILESMVGSPGWFRLLRTHSEFVQWLEKPIEQTVYCAPLLTVAASFASEDVWSLLEEYWLENQAYDHLSIRIAWSLDVWTAERVDLIQKIVQRTPTDWHAVAAIAEKIAEEFPNLAAQIIRAYLDQRLAKATAESQIPPPELPPDADDVQRYMHAYKYDSKNPLKRLLEGGNDLYEIDKFAQDNPKSFLNSNWPWLVCVVDKIAPEPNSKTTSYRDDYAFSLDRHNGEILEAFLIAILTLAEQDMQAFISFFQASLQSDLLLVHRLLARGLEKIGDQEPKIILDYLLDDPRRLSLGDSIEGQHHETKRLISKIYHHLSENDREKLDRTICGSDYCHPGRDAESDVRFRFLKYNRQHRLQLLLAIPDDCLRPDVKKLRDEEVRAFPWEIEEDRYPSVSEVYCVGPRMTKAEMSRASDQDLLNLFDELSDDTGWDRPRRKLKDMSRSGGVVQQAREFGELVKDDSSWFTRLFSDLKPQRHESYAGASLEALADTEFSAQDLLSIIHQLNQRGFASEDFRSDAAHALQKIATYNRGLPSEFLDLLINWLINHSKPELTSQESQSEKSSNSKLSIVFGTSYSHFLVNGRGSIVRAIAEGYLKQEPPDLEGWDCFIRSQLGVEQHPDIWVDILAKMPSLLNGDAQAATELFDQVIQNCPEILNYRFSLHFISRTIGWFDPSQTVQLWLDMLRDSSSDFSRQAYGELLLIQYLQCQDEWSEGRINEHLENSVDDSILCGLAHAASHLWVQRRCRRMATRILCALASSSHEPTQHAVANVFHWCREHFRLDSSMTQIIYAVRQNQAVLLEAANSLVDIIEAKVLVDSHPQLVAEICTSLLNIGAELTNVARPTAFIADSLTTLSIQLHRQPAYRVIGLQLFERLLELNLRETQAALETLDRRPSRSGGVSRTPRRRRRRTRAKTA